MDEEKSKKTRKQKIGLALIVTPIVLFLLVAFANGFTTSQCWLGSCGMDRFLGILAVLAVITGVIMLLGKKE